MKKNAFLLFHLSTGDNFTVYALVIYLQSKYEKLFIFCLDRNLETVTQLYSQFNNIIICKIEDSEYINSTISNNALNKFTKNIDNYEIIKSGSMHPEWFKKCCDFWTFFYTGLGLDYNMRYKYNNISRNISREKNIYNKVVEKYGSKYVFLHDHRNYVYKHKDSRNNVYCDTNLPIFHPNYNYYNDDKNHKYYKLWNDGFYLNNLLDYCMTIENATEIHVSDSSFSCMCVYLDLSKVKNKVIYSNLNYISYHKSFINWKISPPQ